MQSKANSSLSYVQKFMQLVIADKRGSKAKTGPGDKSGRIVTS